MTISPIPVFKDKNQFLTDIPGAHTLPCFPTLWFSVYFMILPSVKKKRKKKRSVDFEIPGAIILLLWGDRDVMWLNISAVTTGVFVSVAPFCQSAGTTQSGQCNVVCCVARLHTQIQNLIGQMVCCDKKKKKENISFSKNNLHRNRNGLHRSAVRDKRHRLGNGSFFFWVPQQS